MRERRKRKGEKMKEKQLDDEKKQEKRRGLGEEREEGGE